MANKRTLYGIPYMGSKQKIAVEILKQLPKGKRFVDLFGGGFAMTHAAILTHKWEKFYYNDFNKLLVDLIQNAINGKYNYKNFKPPFITREMFNELKEKDGYVKYIWSFGNNGQAYLFGKDIEHAKYLGHQLIVFNKLEQDLYRIAPDILNYVKSPDIYHRRLELQAYMKNRGKGKIATQQSLYQTERLQQLENLERLERLQQLERLELHNQSYEFYSYQDGDVVYCDPPYEDTAEYSGGFDHKKFYDWVASRPYQVWFSSYNNISDKRFKMVWASQKYSLLRGGNGKIKYECLYTNK